MRGGASKGKAENRRAEDALGNVGWRRLGIMAMIAEIEDYFTLGCGRCDRFATTDCSARKWSAGLDALRAGGGIKR
jgi:hypothetical protein